MAINLDDNIRVGQQKPTDDRYFNNLVPYTSVAEANSLLPLALRHIGLTVNIIGVEYWYKDGIEDVNLVIKSSSSGVSNHNELNNLNWIDSGHVGDNNKIAYFNSSGGTDYIDPNSDNILNTSNISGNTITETLNNIELNYIKKNNETLPILTGNSIIIPYSPLYNKYVVDDLRGVAPTGFHIPTEIEVNDLITYLGGNSVAGGKMKEIGISHWNSPNSFSNNSSGFNAIPTGYRYYDAGEFSEQGYSYWFYTTTGGRKLTVDSEAIFNTIGGNNNGFNIRCIKDNNNPSNTSIIDASGNIYNEIVIGNQIWLIEDLRTTKYNNGDDIPNLLDNNDWVGANYGALCYYNNVTPPNYNLNLDYELMILTTNGDIMIVNKEQFISQTNLTYSASTETITIYSDSGTDITLEPASIQNAGLLNTTDKIFLINLHSLSGSTYVKNGSSVAGTTITDALNTIDTQISANQLTFASIYGYYNFI